MARRHRTKRLQLDHRQEFGLGLPCWNCSRLCVMQTQVHQELEGDFPFILPRPPQSLWCDSNLYPLLTEMRFEVMTWGRAGLHVRPDRNLLSCLAQSAKLLWKCSTRSLSRYREKSYPQRNHPRAVGNAPAWIQILSGAGGVAGNREALYRIHQSQWKHHPSTGCSKAEAETN